MDHLKENAIIYTIIAACTLYAFFGPERPPQPEECIILHSDQITVTAHNVK